MAINIEDADGHMEDQDWGLYADQGTDFSEEDLGTPFLDILQPNSAEITDGSYDNAKAGNFIRRSTREIFSSFTMIPIGRRHEFVEWVTIENGGGLVGRHEIDSPTVRNKQAHGEKKGVYINPTTGNDLVETFYIACLVEPEGQTGYSKAVIPFTSTKIQTYRTLCARIDGLVFQHEGRSRRYPIFAHKWKVTSAKRQEKSRVWFVPEISLAEGTAEASRLEIRSSEFSLAKETFDWFQEGNLLIEDKQFKELEPTSEVKQITGDTPF